MEQDQSHSWHNETIQAPNENVSSSPEVKLLSNLVTIIVPDEFYVSLF